MKSVTKDMASTTKTMGKGLQSMKLEKIQEVMDKFEQKFEDTDVMAATVAGAMDSSTSMSTPQSEIEQLMREVADENQLEMGEAMPGANVAQVKKAVQQKEDEDDELLARLAKLKAPQ